MPEIVLVKLNGTGVTNKVINWAGAFTYIGLQWFRLTAKRKKNWKNWLFSDRLFLDPIF